MQAVPGSSLHPTGECELVTAVSEPADAYLFGQYLGDGCLSEGRRRVFRLRIATCDDSPLVRDECEQAIHQVMPGRAIGRARGVGCAEVTCYSKHWPCLFPQHGQGRKHERPLILRAWQQRIVFESRPREFLRGLIHSDGCRVVNRVKRVVAGRIKRYDYPRYFFTNESGHVRGFFVEACNHLDIRWRFSKPNTISVARRDCVARLDEFVGPKC
jgi:hypothetical protein